MTNKLIAALLCSMIYYSGYAQRCSQQAMLQYFETIHPGSIKEVAAQKAKAIEQYRMNTTALNTFRTTADTVLIPVIFHVIIDSNQFKSLGGIPGIEERIATQMTVLNEDYNARNADITGVPPVWTSLIGNLGVSFGLAHVSPTGAYSLGYELKIVPNGTSFTAEDGGKGAKFAASGGLDAWDNTKYFNIWVVNLMLPSSTALGIAAPPGFPGFTKPELGIALNYLVLGSRTSPSQPFIRNFDKGRTLTHEIGHYFYLFHIWGDDGGDCSADDGFSDTPLQAGENTGKPKFPKFDICTPSGNGVMFMNYMDYSDDLSLIMFTKQQSDMVKSQLRIGGQSYSLTQHPNLSDTQFKPSGLIKIYPNPTTRFIYLDYDNALTPLQGVNVFNMLGQKVIETTEQGINTIDIGVLAKGVYFVHCIFKDEIIIKKITLQ